TVPPGVAASAPAQSGREKAGSEQTARGARELLGESRAGRQSTSTSVYLCEKTPVALSTERIQVHHQDQSAFFLTAGNGFSGESVSTIYEQAGVGPSALAALPASLASGCPSAGGDSDLALSVRDVTAHYASPDRPSPKYRQAVPSSPRHLRCQAAAVSPRQRARSSDIVDGRSMGRAAKRVGMAEERMESRWGDISSGFNGKPREGL
ncbi:hypothetical protein SKAU_G00046980, partial [Synaphobranchus kaupii]